MKYITILVIIFFSTGLFGQTDKLTADSKGFISKRIKIYEPNPIHKDLSTSIVGRFQNMLINFPDCKLDTSLFTRLLIENSETSYEDSQEAYRLRIRRSLIFTFFAMSVSLDKRNLYLDLAEKTLFNSENRIDLNIVETYSGILILDLLVKDLSKTLNSADLKRIKEKYQKIEALIDNPIYDQGFLIIESYEIKMKK